MAFGLLLLILDVKSYTDALSEYFSNIFLIILLPPIIFESGYNIKKRPFFKNFGTILIFSFVGTFIAVFSSSCMFWLFGQTSFCPTFTW